MKLVFPDGEHPQVLLGAGVNRIGSGPGASIVLDHPGVRPEHCQLHVTGQGVMLSASAGIEVSVNGLRVEGVMALRPGDTVAFHEVRAKLVELDANAAARRTVLDDCARSAANDDPGATAVRAVLPRFMLRGVEGSVAGRTFPLLGPVVVGRSEECGLRMDEEGLSRKHARLVPTSEGVQLEDLGSTNGSYVNGSRVLRAELRDGDEVSFDTLRFRLSGPAGPKREEAPPPLPGLRRLPAIAWVGAAAAVSALAWWLSA